VDEAYWAMELRGVEEVLSQPAITTLPVAPVAVLGVCNRRGDVLPVVSIATLAGERSEPSEAERRAPWVVVVEVPGGPGRAAGTPVGVAVTAAPETAELGAAVAPGEGPAALSVHRVMIGASPVAVTLVDPAGLITASRIAGDN
jgi:chemotaxis signal transduction protein